MITGDARRYTGVGRNGYTAIQIKNKTELLLCEIIRKDMIKK
jgi:hypothetical protein